MSSQVNYKLTWKAARWSRSVSTAFEPSEVSPYPRDVSETMVPAAPPGRAGGFLFLRCHFWPCRPVLGQGRATKKLLLANAEF